MKIPCWEELDDHNPGGDRFSTPQHSDIIMVSVTQHIKNREDHEKDVQYDINIAWIKGRGCLSVHDNYNIQKIR